MQENDSELLAFMTAKALNQAQIAKRARVSQATVSRALKGGARKRRGSAYIRLFTYIHKENRRAGVAHANKDEVLQAFDRIWDASHAYAVAVAKVINALDGLRPSQIEEE
jgi:transcriptional regulator with XRE-family HTH domain